MIIYNVTVNVEDEIQEQWLSWMKEVHIPDVMSTGLFVENKICKVLGVDDEGTTYSVQYTCKNMDDYNRYQAEFAPRLQKEHSDKFREKFVAFRSLLEVV
jgi:hypothetical protein